MGTVYINMFFWLQKTQFYTRRHSNPHDQVVATLEKKTKLQLLGPEGELSKAHQWSRVRSTSSCTSREGQIIIVSDKAEKVGGSHGAMTVDAQNFQVKLFS
jgi:hypothetical protein